MIPEHTMMPASETPDEHPLVEESLQRPGLRAVLDLADHMLQLAWMADGDGRFFWFNLRWFEFTGTTPEQMEGEGWQRVFVPEQSDEIATRLQDGFRRQVNFETTIQIRSADGAPHWFLWRAFPVSDGRDRILCWYGMCKDVGSQRPVPEEIEPAGTQFESVLRSIQDAVLVVDEHGDFVFANDVAARVGGFADAAEIRRHGPALRDLFQVLTPGGDPLPPDRRPLSRIMRGETLTGLELPIRRIDTGQSWICSFSGQPVRDTNGRQVLSVLVMRDITYQRRAEEALFKNASLVRSITNTTSDAIFAKDRAGRYIMANPATAAAIGRSEAEMLDRTDLTLFRCREFAEETMVNDQRIMEMGKPEVLEEHYCGSGDSVRTWLATKTPFRDHTGQVVGLVGIAREITERKRQEEQLRAHEAWFRLLAESMPQIVWTAEPDGRLDHWNHRAMEFTGIGNDAGPAVWDSIVHPADLAEVLGTWRLSLSTGEDFSIELRLRRHDGVFRWHLCRALPVRDDDGRIFKWIGTMTDIDDQRSAKELLETRVGERTAELERRSAELQASNMELERFAYVASHDLQEPLRTVTSFTQLLSRRLSDRLDPETSEFIGYIVDGSRRMQNLIHDLLAFSRVGRTEEELLEVEVESCLRTALADLDAEIRESGGEVRWSTLPRALARPSQLSQVFLNLIGNALKFRRTEVPPTVEISGTREGDGWVISVRDNGVGIDPQYRDRVFQAFQRLQTWQERPGSGIGLAICKKIIEGHGGRIWVESAEGGGSIFRFTIPVAAAQAVRAAAEQ